MRTIASPDTRICPRPQGCAVPLSSQQKGVWRYFLELGPFAGPQCEPSLRIRGTLAEEILHRSIDVIAGRHEALRTSFVLASDTPVRIAPRREHNLCVVDLRGAGDHELALQVKILSEEFLCAKTDFVRGPLFSTKLLKLSDTDHVLLAGIDHIVTDGTSSGIVRNEIEALYRKGEQNLSLSLPAPTLQYGDYAVWQQQTFASWRNAHEQFWRERAAGLSKFDLPTDSAVAGSDHQLRWTMSEFTLGKDLLHKLSALALKQKLLLPLVFLAIISATLSRWCDRSEWAIDFVSHGRHGHPELADTVGFLSTILQLRFIANPDETLLRLLERIHLDYTSAIAHQDYGRLHEVLPIFTAPVIFNWAPANWTRPTRIPSAASAVEFTTFPLYQSDGRLGSESRALNFRISPNNTGCIVRIVHQENLFTPRTIDNLRNAFQATAEMFVVDPLVRLGSLRFSMPATAA